MAVVDKTFFMLGIIHRDESCRDRLVKWLNREKPQVITLELSNYGLTFREKMGDYYKQRLEENLKKIGFDRDEHKNRHIVDIRTYMEIPYEYRAVRDYVRDCGGFIYLIDMDIFSLMKLKEIESLINIDNLRTLLTLEDNGMTQSEQVFARLYFEKGIKTFDYTEEMRIRDIHMKDMIWLLMGCHSEKRFLHICGWRHLYDPYNIYGQLNPIKVFIYD
ncbi:MAG TPA: hypothetical protein PLP52_09475 [Syntrophorhabdaceae bacterium]|nr:hypothetical protein [Syntrophorhabdaceae bacterium]HQK47158.1 hypothetical protein [Syntrophorhabdaceae bacterium]